MILNINRLKLKFLIILSFCRNELAQTERSRHYSSRAQIEYEIFNMIKNILLFDQHQTCQSLYIADGRCHFDVLFDK